MDAGMTVANLEMPSDSVSGRNLCTCVVCRSNDVCNVHWIFTCVAQKILLIMDCNHRDASCGCRVPPPQIIYAIPSHPGSTSTSNELWPHKEIVSLILNHTTPPTPTPTSISQVSPTPNHTAIPSHIAMSTSINKSVSAPISTTL